MYASLNAGDLSRFCCCWSSAGDKLEMLESLVECGRLGNYALVKNYVYRCLQLSKIDMMAIGSDVPRYLMFGGWGVFAN